MGAVADAYVGCRTRITDLVHGLDAARAALPVAACPNWTAHDVVAHITGVVDDVLSGRLDGVATDGWTAAQVEARRGTTIDEMLTAWHAQAPNFESFLDDIGPPGRQAVGDLVTHEHDLRGALGQPGARASDAVTMGFAFMARGFINAARAQGVSVRVGPVGEADASIALDGEPFELMRAVTGRRSAAQLRAFAWRGDVDAALPLFTWGPFRPAPLPIIE